MRKGRIIPIALLSAALAVATLPAAGQTQSELIKRGDDAYTRLEDQAALDAYLAAAKLEPPSYEALWKAARSLVDVGDLVDAEAKGGEERKMALYKDAEDHARKAAAVKPDDANGHFQISLSMGKQALMLGKKDQIRMAKEVRAEIEKTIALDPTHDSAYHALGRWHRKMAEIGGAKRLLGGLLYGALPKGSFEESATYLKKAVELRPNFINHHLELGRTLMELKKYGEAVAEFQACLDLPAATSKDPGYKKEAGAELVKAEKKAR
jgi:tetratricopeptide (TPR) repeat protein